MKKKKFYVVWEGWEIGVFDNWRDCKDNTHKYKGAKFKSFKSLNLAEKAFTESYEDYKGKRFVMPELSSKELEIIGKPIIESISVDAACSGNPGIMEYQAVYTKTKKVLFKMGPFEEGTNNLGEFLALVHAVALLKKDRNNVPIYSDSKIAISWVRDKAVNTSLERNTRNYKVFSVVDRAVKWLKENEFNNKILKWETKAWGEIPADFGRK